MGVLPNIAPGATAPSDIPSPATALAPSPAGGVGGPGQSLPPNPPPSNRFDTPATLESLSGNFRFGPGFEHMTQYVNFMFEWEHAMFNEPVIYAPGKRHGSGDPLLARIQLFF
jgi:phosphate-selective porin OprO/OprP